jgi:TRAP-type C4-dicarboxylate transport system permease small subunit
MMHDKLEHEGEPLVWAEDEPVDLSDLRPDDGIVLALFWALAVVVFLQFFTRYVLNSSLGWTEEIARYLLIAVTFVGSAMAVRKRSHIAVEFFYRYFGPAGRHRLALAVDLISLLFYGFAAWLTARLALRTKQLMSSVDLSKSLIYWAVCLGLVGMTLYALRNLIHRLRSPPSDEDLPHSRLID